MSRRLRLRNSRDGPKMAKDDENEESLAELNGCLSVLASIFPRIRPEVFREMLQTFDGESLLYVVVEQLLKHQDKWVKGRWRSNKITEVNDAAAISETDRSLVNAEDEFRRASYKWTARRFLYEEFKVLSRSKIEAVLAEENFYYSRARPTLQILAGKSWRNTLNTILSKWRKHPSSVIKDHYMMVLNTVQGDMFDVVPTLRETGDPELDLELHTRVLKPYLERIAMTREIKDRALAVATNRIEAERFGAVYECECCYSDTTFEQMAACTTEGHIVCFDCIWHAISEALFGQSWDSSIDHDQGQLRCIALTSHKACGGCIPQSMARRAILQGSGQKEALAKLESRFAEKALFESRLPLIRCPFCTYSEVDELYLPPTKIQYKLRNAHLRHSIALFLVMLNLFPLLFVYSLLSCFLPFQAPPPLTCMFSSALDRLHRAQHLSRRFQCRSPRCGLSSCLTCSNAWQDPHICHESATQSLRTTVEAACTAALKRTCPRCQLGFIKDSGCNKLTCVCGYSMCYVCREGLGRGTGGEGYRHFCQHFRPTGDACKDCDKCDLYKTEDEKSLVSRAGALAEQEWRKKESMVGVEGIGAIQYATEGKSWWTKGWTLQGLLDWWVGEVISC